MTDTTAMHAGIHAGITETTGRGGEIAGLRRVLLAFGVGGAMGFLLWMTIWLSVHL